MGTQMFQIDPWGRICSKRCIINHKILGCGLVASMKSSLIVKNVVEQLEVKVKCKLSRKLAKIVI